jgi:hypothetical protein
MIEWVGSCQASGKGLWRLTTADRPNSTLILIPTLSPLAARPWLPIPNGTVAIGDHCYPIVAFLIEKALSGK